MEKWNNDENSTVSSIIAEKLLAEIVLCLGEGELRSYIRSHKAMVLFDQYNFNAYCNQINMIDHN